MEKKQLKELEKEYINAIPEDLKEFVSLFDSLGYCDKCSKKTVLTYYRTQKQSLCLDCSPLIEEYSPFEFGKMWEIAHKLLFHLKQEGGNGIPPTNKLVGILPKRL